ncbi:MULTISPECIES: PH domain-containing protein [unclassified Kaistella]|uniref:PH domain-containing protein n=1 Tax=unclassified Kaistella TaxID=2762626 RepID=UPI0027369D67|nr:MULTISPECIES: PH domain-containing protein [unclassified Kaistella]MDP2453122.1 PH domain-containing protein [Kaistella sp. SH11-4b]MDP2456179.1 PH domain-containing protein [Kaistella sp. SH40-3]MDP2458935.1 PH domain-containing protein [Kaistella sp. SH19-2b]
MMNVKEFSTAKMDNTTKIITVIVLFFLLLLPFSTFLSDQPQPVFLVTSFVLMYGAIFISYGFIPKRIAVSDDQILIKNLFGPVLINIDNIETIAKIEKLGLNLRTFGVGGLFGYFGYFNGKDVWYVTNRHKKVKMILKSGKVYIISPENPDDFVKEIEKRKSELER